MRSQLIPMASLLTDVDHVSLRKIGREAGIGAAMFPDKIHYLLFSLDHRKT